MFVDIIIITLALAIALAEKAIQQPIEYKA